MIESKALNSVGEAVRHCALLLQQSDVSFGHGTDNAWDEALVLVLTAAGLPVDSDNAVMQAPLSEQAGDLLTGWLQRRIELHEPAPYIVGKAWFAGLELHCDPRAIVPRSPFAELILDGFQPWLPGGSPERVLDLCCGGGCIGLATAFYFPDSRVDLVDLDAQALALARENTQALNLQERIEILQSDLFQAVAGRRYDLILSNPPYVDRDDLRAMPAEYGHEPALSLASGSDGLDLTRRILAQAGDYLAPDGVLMVEVGNSWAALEAAFPRVAFTWIELEQGGHGLFTLSAREVQDYSAYLRG